MTTAKQAAANRRNARKSTGPKTAKGKAISSRNSIKHGLLSEELVIRGENSNQLTALKQSLQIELQPEGMFEDELVHQITMHFWRLRRVRVLETGIFANAVSLESKESSSAFGTLDRVPFESFHVSLAPIEALEDELDSQEDSKAVSVPIRADRKPDYRVERPNKKPWPKQENQEDKLRRMGRVFEHSEKILANLQRYRVAIERSLYRALHELERIQTARGGGSALAPTILDLQASDVSGQA